jgi:hypothetical protein
MIMRCALLAAAMFLGVAMGARADNDVHGRIEIQDLSAFARADSLDALLHARDRNDIAGNVRLTWEPSWDRWSVAFHYVVDADYGDGARLARVEGGLLPLVPSTWFDLDDTFESHGDLEADHRIDRLSVGYAAPDFVVRIGRQALTWGGGLVFRPMDLFDPFAPNATDTEFKPGADMAYGQLLFEDGSDLQAIAVPRPERRAGPLSADASSFALHYRFPLGTLQATLLAARDRGDWTAAGELAGPLGGASWDIELVPTFERAGVVRVAGLANISDAVTLIGRNATVFGEYFHNGFGITGHASLTALPADLVARLARGQLFSLRQNYLATGMTLEWNPLLNLSPTLIGDLDDGSVYALFAANYSVADNVTLIAGAQAPLGRRGSEFGGIPVAGQKPPTIGASPELYLQVRRYF